MKDAWRGKPVVGQFRNPIPREAVFLAATPERSTPEVGHVMPERRERPTICWARLAAKLLWRPSKTSIGNPPGLLGVFTIIGGTAAIRTALATRPLPCRATYRATSRPPVE